MTALPALGRSLQRQIHRQGVVRPVISARAQLRLDLKGLRRALARIGLPVWFVTISAGYIQTWTLAIDARLYQQATNTWLAGGDPWAITIGGGVPYAAAPWSLLMYVATAWLPLEAATWTWTVLGLGAALWTLRRLGLPMWWLAFPPLTLALWNGNAQLIVLAALMVRTPWGVMLAGGLKLYGLVPAIVAGRWRAVALAGVGLGLAATVLPWGMYVEHRFGLDTVAAYTWNGSAWRFPPLMPIAVLALWVVRRKGAEWLAIPALWPGTQLFYHVFALPVLRDKPWLAAALAIPLPMLAPIAVIAYAVLEGRRAKL